jgi:MinD-like ATPase involved in chromosome partitioning or flagellar assembly
VAPSPFDSSHDVSQPTDRPSRSAIDPPTQAWPNIHPRSESGGPGPAPVSATPDSHPAPSTPDPGPTPISTAPISTTPISATPGLHAAPVSAAPLSASPGFHAAPVSAAPATGPAGEGAAADATLGDNAASDAPASGRVGVDSPWSQPPQVRAPVDQPRSAPVPPVSQSSAPPHSGDSPSGEHSALPRPDWARSDASGVYALPHQRTDSSVPPSPSVPDPSAVTGERAAYYPTVTPRRGPGQDNSDPRAEQNPQPSSQFAPPPGPQYDPQPAPQLGAQPGGGYQQNAPGAQTGFPPAPTHDPQTGGPTYPPPPMPVNANPAYPQPNQGYPSPGYPPQPQYTQPTAGPYPPAIDPRAVPPHPHVAPQPQVNADQHQQPTDGYNQAPWTSDGTAPTAEEFARRRLARPAEPVATMGPRAVIQRSTLGLMKFSPGRREQEYKQDVEMVRRNFGGLRQVTIVNPKGGAGKTVAVLLLAMTFGQKRGGYVLAWDNNETQGTLGMRAQQDFHARTVRDMMRDLHLFRGAQGRVGDLSQYVRAQGEGMFDVLASDESATAGEMLTANAFGEIREIVSRFYKLIFVDTGNNVRAQNWQAAMDATDQLVVTMSARNDSAETAARMLDHLEQSGRQRLVRQAISVVSMPPTRKDIDLPAIQRHFAARTRAVLISPYEKLIDSGEPLRYAQLSTDTKNAWLKIAAAVAEGL